MQTGEEEDVGSFTHQVVNPPGSQPAEERYPILHPQTPSETSEPPFVITVAADGQRPVRK
jgi:hypothetical protein